MKGTSYARNTQDPRAKKLTIKERDAFYVSLETTAYRSAGCGIKQLLHLRRIGQISKTKLKVLEYLCKLCYDTICITLNTLRQFFHREGSYKNTLRPYLEG